MKVEVLTDKPYLFSGLYERTKFAAPGLDGGHAGATGRVRTNNGAVIEPKISRIVPSDTVVVLELPGGGGFGDPLQREISRVASDVVSGYVSIDWAREDYGVVIDGAGVVDANLTKELRARKRTQASIFTSVTTVTKGAQVSSAYPDPSPR